MPEIVYYVAISLDGYISGPAEDISMFVGEGSGVTQYRNDLNEYKTVIMGRKTYEFGYQYGLIPGKPAYPHMDHYIFSKNLNIEDLHPKVHIEPHDINRIRQIREQSPTDVYLCGGGVFAGWLLDNNMIDVLKVKINPIILGAGVRLFGDSTTSASFELLDSQLYDLGLQINTYKIRNHEN